MRSVDQQRQHFESISDEYFEARQEPNHLYFKALLWDYFFARNCDVLGRDSDVIEPMCGYSEGKKILEKFCESRFSYTGFDFSPKLVDRARQAFPDANIYVQDVTTFQSNTQYDLMILIGGLHHVYAHVSSVMEKLVGAIKPGGYLINLEPTQNNVCHRWIRQMIYRNNDLFDDETEKAFDLKELNCLFRNSGLEIEDQIYPGLLAYVMYYNPDAFPSLNIGSEKLVNLLFKVERHLYGGWLARKFSFATLSLLKK